jgi:hypothetical protein
MAAWEDLRHLVHQIQDEIDAIDPEDGRIGDDERSHRYNRRNDLHNQIMGVFRACDWLDDKGSSSG